MEKSKIRDLLDRLGQLYGQIRLLAPYPFPLLHIARARVWRGFPLPANDELLAAMEQAAQRGMSDIEVSALIVVTETLFRSLKAVELAVEGVFPAFAEKWAGDFMPVKTYESTLADVEFMQLWEMRAREVGEGWVLAAGRRPIWIGGRPSLVSPKILGSAVAERLQLEGAPETAALETAARLESVLAGDEVRLEQVRHWQRIYRGILVRLPNEDMVPLTRHLAYPLRPLGSEPPLSPERGFQLYEALYAMSPADYLRQWRLPPSACADFAGTMWRGPYRSSTDGRGRAKGVDLFSCSRCDADEMLAESFWLHLREHHGLSDDVMRTVDGANEVRDSTGTLLGKWRRGPASQLPKTPSGRRRTSS